MGSAGVRERRWAVVAATGQHAWLGRSRDPSDSELEEVARQLEAQGIAAWLAVTEGVYYSGEPMTVMMVRPISGVGDWEAARQAFLAARAARLAETG